MFKVTMLIPIKDNNGNTIDPNAIGRCLNDILNLCGGYTRGEPTFTGAWKDDGGKLYLDTLFPVMVCCDKYELIRLRDIVARIAQICKQECLFFEYHETTVEFIKPQGKPDDN